METNSFSFYLTLCCRINATFADGAGGTFKSSKLNEMINSNTTSGHVFLVWELGSNSIDPPVVALPDRHRVRFGGREAFARAIVFGWTENLHFHFALLFCPFYFYANLSCPPFAYGICSLSIDFSFSIDLFSRVNLNMECC